MNESRILRMGMVGGGPGAFIGPVHRMAAELDGRIRLVAGAFSSDPKRSEMAGRAWGLDAERVYPDYETMFSTECNRPDGIDFVTVATPNYLHLPVVRAAIDAGIPVMSDKPATATWDEALALGELLRASAQPYALTHTYAGYALVRQARLLVAEGRLGPLRRVAVEYLQGWLSQPIEQNGHKQAGWRVDPAKSGPGGAIGDIGTHAFHLLEYVSGERVLRLNAQLRSVVPGRAVDDDATAWLELSGGATGTLSVSQVATGERNGLRLRLWGEKASLSWQQEDPNRLHLVYEDGHEETLHAGTAALDASVLGVSRLPAGHPEGYLEAFAVLYREFADFLLARRQEPTLVPPATLPGLPAAMRGMRFIERMIVSNRRQSWVEFEER